MDDVIREHKVVIEDRKTISISAVEDVESFDEEKIVVLCDECTMTVSGSEFRINKLNVDDGKLEIEGNINEITYSENVAESGGGLFKRLFR